MTSDEDDILHLKAVNSLVRGTQIPTHKQRIEKDRAQDYAGSPYFRK